MSYAPGCGSPRSKRHEDSPGYRIKIARRAYEADRDAWAASRVVALRQAEMAWQAWSDSESGSLMERAWWDACDEALARLEEAEAAPRKRVSDLYGD